MKITDVKTVLLTGPSGNDPFLQRQRKHRSAAFIEIHTDTEMIGIGETYIAILELPPLAGPLHTEIYADGYRFEDGYILPPEAPGLGIRLTDELKTKYPFVRGSGEWNPVPGKMELH